MVPEARFYKTDKNTYPKAAIFMSSEFYKPDLDENKKRTALVLIQGTGAVRAGIWARSVCINDNHQLGTMLPQVEWAT